MKQQDLLTPCASIQTPKSAATIAVLPPTIATWLQAEHEQLANALSRAHTDPESSIDGEAMLAVDDLPEATKRFLWRGMQRHHPALSELVRDPLAAELRAIFGARLHLRVADLVHVICLAAPAAGS